MNERKALPEAFELAVRKILHGIDLNECEDDSGWWVTDKGVEFGKDRLRELLSFLAEAMPPPVVCGEPLATGESCGRPRGHVGTHGVVRK